MFWCSCYPLAFCLHRADPLFGLCGARELATSDWLLPWELSHSIGFLSELAVDLSQNSRKGDSVCNL